MSVWIDRILSEFPADLCRLWIAADPDNLLLDEQILAGLRTRGFEVLPFEDSIAFRAEFEERYRAAWDRGESGPANSLVIHLRGTNINDLPWDYLRKARKVSLSLADLFPKLSYAVVRQLDAEYLEQLFDAQTRHISHLLGETSTKDFILTHIFQLSPHVISSLSDFWRDLLRMRNRNVVLPRMLADRVAHILADRVPVYDLPIQGLFSSKSMALRFIQWAWTDYITQLGAVVAGTKDSMLPENIANFGIPFDHPDVRVIIESFFLDGTLHREAVQQLPPDFPVWAKIGIAQDPDEQRNLVSRSIHALTSTIPTVDSSHREWMKLARRFGEVTAQFHLLDSTRADSINEPYMQLQRTIDEHLRGWVASHYGDLPSLPAMRGPIVVHQVPRFLSFRRDSGETKVALLVFDGMAIDQWNHIRESLAKQTQRFDFEENACFAWLPTLTSVSRQALFSGLKPREFPLSIQTTSQEPAQWARFWQDQGLRANKVFYRKGIKHTHQLKDLGEALDNPLIEVAGIVVSTVDDFVHGAVLGKRGVAHQIASWVESGFVEELFSLLLNKGFCVYLTADHGNHEAVGQGRPNHGVASELRGERVRVYTDEILAKSSCVSMPNAFRSNISGLPSDFLPMFATGDTAFVGKGEHIVAHGGMSIDELIVPFVRIASASESQ